MDRDKIKEKIDEAKFAYYNTDTPIMSDKEYDELIKLYGNEPYIGAPVLDSIEKIIITDRPMLSLNKVHSIDEIRSFANNKELIATIKCDGLSVRLIYDNGKLIGANTRGDGKIGGNIFSHVHYIQNIPLSIPRSTKTFIDGEVIIYDKDFDKEKFKNQRNAAAGGLALLNMQEVKERKMSFIAWDIFSKEKYSFYSQKLKDAIVFGFDVVPWTKVKDYTLYQAAIDFCLEKAKINGCPCDGVVFKINDIEYGESLGSTEHHFKNAVAWKKYDETYSTRLRHITWTMGRTGVLTPVAIFDPIEIDGTEVSRASLHNVSIMKELLGDCAYVGEPLEVFKSNMIIPQIYSAGPKYDYGYVIANGGVSANDAPEYCPICGGDISFKKENNIIRAYCDNPNCEGKLINRLDHFCGKKGLDIKGLSKATLTKLINWEWVNSIADIFTLHSHQSEWIKKSGFGQASVSKIINAIEEAKKCSLDKYLCALGIPLIGKVASKALREEFCCYEEFRKAINNKDKRLYNIYGFGENMITSLLEFDYTEADNIFKKYIIEPTGSALKAISKRNIPKILENKIFVITGRTKIFKNRDELKNKIEEYGGKVVGTVTSKTSYLINNDIDSNSSKNITAKKLNIPIISENDLVLMITTCPATNENDLVLMTAT